jgi:hypothetical protein
VELFEEIRREYGFAVGSVAGVARKFGVHRRLVREALGSAVPKQRPTPGRPRPTIEPVAAFIDAVFEADRRAPRKQRHTAHRIWVRIAQERPGYRIAESTVRQYVRLRKQALGLRVAPEPVVFIGGSGKTHLLTALCVAACRQRRRVRFTTAAALVNELVEAKQQLQLRRVLVRWARYDVIAIDLRSGGASRGLTDDQPAVLRVDPGHSQRTPMQGVAG